MFACELYCFNPILELIYSGKFVQTDSTARSTAAQQLAAPRKEKSTPSPEKM